MSFLNKPFSVLFYAVLIIIPLFYISHVNLEIGFAGESSIWMVNLVAGLVVVFVALAMLKTSYQRRREAVTLKEVGFYVVFTWLMAVLLFLSYGS